MIMDIFWNHPIDELKVEERKERKERYSKEKQFILFCCYSFCTSQIVVKPQLLVALDNF